MSEPAQADATATAGPEADAAAAPRLRQFFILPLLLVTVLVAVWFGVGWLSSSDAEPQDLVRELRHGQGRTWHKALALANLLRNPRYAELKRNRQAAAELGTLLREQLDAGGTGDDPIKLRVFLCRALGEFDSPDSLPVLIQAVRTERHPAELDVRRAALEAIAVLAAKLPPEACRANEELLAAVTSAAEERDAARDPAGGRSGLCATAAFALGVLGGERAIQVLTRLLADPRPEVRYNAATGLARHGNAAAVPVLVEMLAAPAAEASRAERQYTPALVVANALRAIGQLASKNSTADLQPLATALERLLAADDAEAALSVRAHARETLLALQARPPCPKD